MSKITHVELLNGQAAKVTLRGRNIEAKADEAVALMGSGDSVQIVRARFLRLLDLCPDAAVKNVRRLDDGELSDLGDALLAGKRVLIRVGGEQSAAAYFDGERSDYAIEPDRVEVAGVSFPKPETEAPPHGTAYYIPYPDRGAFKDVWAGADRDRAVLNANLVHLTEDAAQEHAEALIRLSGGAV